MTDETQPRATQQTSSSEQDRPIEVRPVRDEMNVARQLNSEAGFPPQNAVYGNPRSLRRSKHR